MEKWQKLLTQVRASKQNQKPETIVKLMRALNFDDERQGPGGHNIGFRHRTYHNIYASMAANRNPVRVGYVNDCLDAVDELFDRLGAVDPTKKEET